MTIKKYENFVNESLNRTDYVKIAELISNAQTNLNEYKGEEIGDEYFEYDYEDNVLRLRISGIENIPMSQCNNDISLMVLPSNFTPNLMASMKTGSYEKDSDFNNFTVISNPSAVKSAREFFDMNKVLYPELNMILVTLLYNE